MGSIAWRVYGFAGLALAMSLVGAIAAHAAASPVFSERATYPAVDFGTVTTADLNRDGAPDLIETFDGGLVFLIGAGDGTFTEGESIGDTGPIQGTPPSGFVGIIQVERGLITSDRNLDLVVKSAYDGPVETWMGRDVITIFRGAGDGTFEPLSHRLVGVETRGMALGHLNRDHRLDLALAAPAKRALILLYGKRDRGFHGRDRVPAGLEPWDVEIGRFDHDKRQDLTATSLGQTTENLRSILLSHGGRRFDAPVIHPRPADASRGAIADFNGDGRDDFADTGRRVGDPLDNRLQILASQPGGGYAALPAVPLDGQVFAGVHAGQLGGGGLDLLISITRSRRTDVAILEGNGDGTFAAPLDVIDDAGFLRVAEDLNGDGRLDLITAWGDPESIDDFSLRVFLNETPPG